VDTATPKLEYYDLSISHYIWSRKGQTGRMKKIKRLSQK
jgi:hypothetical protein